MNAELYSRIIPSLGERLCSDDNPAGVRERSLTPLEKTRGFGMTPLAARLANEAVNHFCIFSILAPSPSFRDVILVLEDNYQLVLVSDSRVGKIGGALKIEGEFFRRFLARNGAHSRLIVCGTVMYQGDAIPIDAV